MFSEILKTRTDLNSARDYRIARERQSTALSPHATVNDIFHSLQPHIALSASPESERIYLKLLSSGILAILLPTEDLESECESSLIREVLSGMVLWNIVEKMSEPHVIFEMITKVFLSVISTHLTHINNQMMQLVAMVSPQQALSSDLADHKENEKLKLKILLMKGEDSDEPKDSTSVSEKVLYSLDIAYIALSKVYALMKNMSSKLYSLYQSPPAHVKHRKGILQMSFIQAVRTFLSMDKRQPWLLGNLQLLTIPLSQQPAGSLTDKLVSPYSCIRSIKFKFLVSSSSY